MIPCRRQEILKTPSVQKFSELKNFLASKQILCDYSIDYRCHTGKCGEMRHLYVRDADYTRACEALRVILGAG